MLSLLVLHFHYNFIICDIKLGLCVKKCEGYDPIPFCSLYDARDTLITPMTALFEKIYKSGCIPDQWKISKIIPIFKKGPKTKIEYCAKRSTNLCNPVTERLFWGFLFA